MHIRQRLGPDIAAAHHKAGILRRGDRRLTSFSFSSFRPVGRPEVDVGIPRVLLEKLLHVDRQTSTPGAGHRFRKLGHKGHGVVVEISYDQDSCARNDRQQSQCRATRGWLNCNQSPAHSGHMHPARGRGVAHRGRDGGRPFLNSVQDQCTGAWRDMERCLDRRCQGYPTATCDCHGRAL